MSDYGLWAQIIIIPNAFFSTTRTEFFMVSEQRQYPNKTCLKYISRTVRWVCYSKWKNVCCSPQMLSDKVFSFVFGECYGFICIFWVELINRDKDVRSYTEVGSEWLLRGLWYLMMVCLWTHTIASVCNHWDSNQSLHLIECLIQT